MDRPQMWQAGLDLMAIARNRSRMTLLRLCGTRRPLSGNDEGPPRDVRWPLGLGMLVVQNTSGLCPNS